MVLLSLCLSLSLSLIVVAAAAVVTIFSQILSLDGHILAHILAATSIGVISATAFHYYHRQKPQKQLEDQTVVPLLDRNESGRVAKLERFSNYVGKNLFISILLLFFFIMFFYFTTTKMFYCFCFLDFGDGDGSARQIGFEDGSECPQLCKLAYKYLQRV